MGFGINDLQIASDAAIKTSKLEGGGADIPVGPWVGNVYWVDNEDSLAVDAGGYGTKALPFKTLDYAIGRCTANKGDVIYVKPGHTETLTAANAVNLDVAGVTVIGIGWGPDRPTFTFTTSTAATLGMNAAGVRIFNCLFIPVDSQTIVIDVNKTDCVIGNCEFRGSASVQWLTAIDLNGGAANACDRLKVLDCVFRSGTAGADNCIGLDEVADGVEIRRCKAWADCNDACIHNPTGKVLTNLTIAECELANLQTGDHSVELVSACTGWLIRNLYHNDMTQATGSDPGACRSFECYHDDVVDTSGILSPAVT